MKFSRNRFDLEAKAISDILSTSNFVDSSYGDAPLMRWEATALSGLSGSLYMINPQFSVTHRPMSDVAISESIQALEDDTVEDDPQQATISGSREEVKVLWSFSVVFSDTYSVPVLYFGAQYLDGSPVPRAQILEWLPEKVQDSWEFVSQEEHPVTGMPSFFLHPCQTAARLEEMLQNEDEQINITWTWMSIVLPAVNHAIPGKLFLQVQKALIEKENVGRI